MKQLVAALALVLAAPALADGAAALYASKCASCHGPDGKSKTKMGEKMGAPDLTLTKASPKEMEKTIAEGKGKMMAYKGKLTDAQIHELAEYVKKNLK